MYLILISTAAAFALVVTGGVAYVNRFYSVKRVTVKYLSGSGLALFLLLWMLMTFAIGVSLDTPAADSSFPVLATLIALTVACTLPWAYQIVKLAVPLKLRIKLARGINSEVIDDNSLSN